MSEYDSFWLSLVKDFKFASVRKYKANNTILFQGEIPPLALAVRRGLVISHTINNNGDEQIISFYSTNDLLPIEWLFNRSPVALYYYRAFTDCELIVLQRDELLDQLKDNEVLLNKLLNQFTSSFIGATVHIHALEHSHSQEKIIKLLHYLVLRFGEAKKDKSEIYTLPFKLTHAQIASMVGVTRESVAIEIVKLKKRGDLSYSKGIYTINLPALIKLVGSEEFNSLKIQSKS